MRRAVRPPDGALGLAMFRGNLDSTRPDHPSTRGPLVTDPPEQPTAGTVMAQRARYVPIRWLNLRETVVLSMWFVPGVFVAGAIGLCGLMLAIDRGTDVDWSWLPGSTPGAAEDLASTVAAGMLTFTAVVFSTTLVAIQLAGGQYSPRVVRVFVRSTLTHVTLGIFLATFVFALGALVEIRDGDDQSVPVLTILTLFVMVLATLVAFIAFSHGIVRLLRVQYLLRTITAHAREAIERFVPGERAYVAAAAPVPSADPALVRNGHRTGVLMSLDMRGLADAGAAAGGWVELLVQPGEYLGEDTPVARVHGGGAATEPAGDLLACLLLGGERTLIQDPGFGLRQLVDIAARALSPAINDPTTAVQVVDRLAGLLAVVAERPDPSGHYADDAGVVRVRAREPGFARLATLAFTEISLFGAGSPQVTRRLLAAYDVLEGITSGERRAVVAGLRARTLAAMETAMPAPFADVAAHPDRLGFG